VGNALARTGDAVGGGIRARHEGTSGSGEGTEAARTATHVEHARARADLGQFGDLPPGGVGR
jgi:hypothetical protein